MNDAQKKRILVVEDEPHLAFNLELNLKEEGYEVTIARNGIEAVTLYKNNGPFDLVILDVMLPELDGFNVAKIIRARDLQTAILLLTARASDDDRMTGLGIGVDDYITKPFHLPELILKVKRGVERVAMFKKSDHGPQATENKIHCGEFTLDPEALLLSGPFGQATLTALEANILSEFMRNPDRVLSREHLLAKVWGMHGNFETRTVDNFVMRLRKIIESDPTKPEVLESVRGRGYRFHVETKE